MPDEKNRMCFIVCPDLRGYREEIDPATGKKTHPLLGKLSVNYWADLGSDNAIHQVTKCVNAAALGEDERVQGFRNAFFELNDETVPNPDYLPVE